MLSCVSIISHSSEIPSLSAVGGERSTATGRGYLKSFSPRVLSMSKNVFCAASFSTQSVLQSAVSLPSKSDIYKNAVVMQEKTRQKKHILLSDRVLLTV